MKRTLIILTATAVVATAVLAAENATNPLLHSRTVGMTVVPVDAGRSYAPVDGTSIVGLCPVGIRFEPKPITPALIVLQAGSAQADSTIADKSSRYISYLRCLAEAKQWDALGKEADAAGAAHGSVERQVCRRQPKAVDWNQDFGGTILPSLDRDALKKQMDHLAKLEFDCPILLVTDLSGDWQKLYDTTFDAAAKAGFDPIIGFCISEMTLGELFRIPEFLSRYEGRYQSVIANYDLTNENFIENPHPFYVNMAAQRVGLTLALIRHASPKISVWLAVGYNRSPSWQEWIGRQNRASYSGIALSGPSAVTACQYIEPANVVRSSIAEVAGSLPVGLLGATNSAANRLSRGDDAILTEHDSLRRGLKGSSFAFVHLKEEAP